MQSKNFSIKILSLFWNVIHNCWKERNTWFKIWTKPCHFFDFDKKLTHADSLWDKLDKQTQMHTEYALKLLPVLNPRLEVYIYCVKPTLKTDFLHINKHFVLLSSFFFLHSPSTVEWNILTVSSWQNWNTEALFCQLSGLIWVKDLYL